jgi:hypothetical protein
MFAAIPGEGHRGEAQHIGVLYASGDFEAAWREGRAFLAERERKGWPPSMALLSQVCQMGVRLRRLPDVSPICSAAGSAAAHPAVAAHARATLALAQGRLADARAELDAFPRAPQRSALPDDARTLEALEAEYLFRLGDYEAAERRLEALLSMTDALPTPALTRAETLRAFAQIELESGRVERGCALLTSAAIQYRSFQGDAGVAAVEGAMRDALCVS